MSNNSSEEINFQHYVEAVKNKEMTWNIFIDFMQVLSYSDINRLKHFNAILLMELTMDYSDLERLKYLNVILLNEFKNAIQKMNDLKTEHINAGQNSSLGHDENNESISDISTESKIQLTQVREDLLLTKFKNSNQKPNNFEIELIEDDQNSVTNYDESIREISTDTQNQIGLIREDEDNLDTSIVKETPEYNGIIIIIN